MNDYDNLEGLDLVAARNEIAFDIKKDNLITTETQLQSDLMELVRADTNQPLGTISRKRELLPYASIMDWTTNAFEKAGVQFKLKESVITKKYNTLYQSYVFNNPIETPDGQSMNMMALVRGSHFGSPAKIDFGTYRFVCSNGAIVGNTITQVNFRASQVNEIIRTEFADQLRMKLDLFNVVVAKYRDIFNKPFSEELNRIVQSEKISFSLKKTALLMAEEDGFVAFPDDLKIKIDNIKTPGLYSNVREGTGWDLYNIMTNIASHRPRSIGGKIGTSFAVSKIFAI